MNEEYDRMFEEELNRIGEPTGNLEKFIYLLGVITFTGLLVGAYVGCAYIAWSNLSVFRG